MKEAETVCHSCYVGGSAPQTQNDAFHNLLTGEVLHWMGEDYWGDWIVDRKKGPKPTDMDRFTHSQQPLNDAVMRKCSMTTTKLRLSKIVTPFPIVEVQRDPNMVIRMIDDQGGTVQSTSSCSSCCVSRAKTKLREQS